MPRLTNSVPKYRRHKSTGQAVVTLSGRDFYLGKYGSESSREEYDRLVEEWLAAGRRTPAGKGLTVAEVMARYLAFAKAYYRPTGEIDVLILSLRPLNRLYGKSLARDFGPLALKSLQHHLVDAGLSRSGINARIGRIRRMFKWAVSEELVPPAVHQGLATVPGLRLGRTKARETEPIRPVGEDVVDKTLPHLPRVVADMVRFQQLTGCRPGEVCILRPNDVETSGDVWEFRPHSHKTQHRGQERVVLIGRRGQQILRPYLLRPESEYCFSPSESEQRRRQERHKQRKTPLSCGNRPGTSRRLRPKRFAGARYTPGAYRRAIHRACDAAFPPPVPLAQREGETQKAWKARLTPAQVEELTEWQSSHRWSPNQLRHARATEIRKRFGLEAAQVTLGHSKADVTQIYAERDLEKAKAVMQQVG